ncbi:hypothetical protein ACN47E_008112 [Coniothyrium glycines]
MADVAVAQHLSQWAFDKPVVPARPQRASSDSTASSPNLCDDASDTLRLATAPPQRPAPLSRKESLVLQERYLSSEEDLTADDASASESEYASEDAVVHDPAKECKARTMSISRWDKGRSCDMAVLVSYAFAGRPKVVEMDGRAMTPPHDRPSQQRAASVAALPLPCSNTLHKPNQAQRLSLNLLGSANFVSSPLDPAPTTTVDMHCPRPSTSYSPATHKTDELQLDDTASTYSSFRTAPSARSPSQASSGTPSRPPSSTADAASARSSVYIPSPSRLDLDLAQATYRPSPFAPLTPQSSALSFLSSDPYETCTTNSSSPIIKKPAPHKRLRSISMKLALAKIAINPTRKPYDARLTGDRMPHMPSAQYIPTTPQTAPLEGSSGFPVGGKLRRASTILRPKSRSGLPARPPTPESAPPVPLLQQKRMTVGLNRMVARGANEREPALVLPPCPTNLGDEPASSMRSENRRLKKRKSLMDFMDSLA